MHFEILVEDQSGQITIKAILEKILGPHGQDHSYRVIPYKGIGRLPNDLHKSSDPKRRLILEQLPRLLKGYGKSLQYGLNAVVVVIDLDRKNCIEFKQELLHILNACDPKPTTLFRIAIEEGEAWLLGDREAIKSAYPNMNDRVLDDYEQDSICGTWEKLADAVYPGGAKKLQSLGWPHTGRAKCDWAAQIAPLMDIAQNQSKAFKCFVTVFVD